VVVDPGFEPDRILELLDQETLTLTVILNTHGHVDHIAGNSELKRVFPTAPIMIGVGDAPMLTDANRNLSAAFGIPITSPAADRTLTEGETLTLAGATWSILEIPGHSPGHIVFVEPTQGVIFGGDVLFHEGIGRTDFPGGSFGQLKKGLREKLFRLPPEYVVYPGHGIPTTIGHEKTANPFVGDGY
jgi:glyoxylase-like metal-dependent hydrolase (beta-lactamase superfamily II)